MISLLSNFVIISVIDDCINDKNQQVQKDFFTRGRNKNCSVIYQSQDYFSVEPIIRKNANCFIFFSMNDYNLTSIIRSVNIGMNRDKFKQICRHQWCKPRERKYIFINSLADEDDRVKLNLF